MIFFVIKSCIAVGEKNSLIFWFSHTKADGKIDVSTKVQNRDFATRRLNTTICTVYELAKALEIKAGELM